MLRAPWHERCRLISLFPLFRLSRVSLGQQAHRNQKQCEAANGLQERQLQQEGGGNRECNAQHRRACSIPLAATLIITPTARKRATSITSPVRAMPPWVVRGSATISSKAAPTTVASKLGAAPQLSAISATTNVLKMSGYENVGKTATRNRLAREVSFSIAAHTLGAGQRLYYQRLYYRRNRHSFNDVDVR